MTVWEGKHSTQQRNRLKMTTWRKTRESATERGSPKRESQLSSPMCDAKLVRAVSCQILPQSTNRSKNSRPAPAARASTNVPRTKVTAPQDNTTQGSIEQSHHYAAVAEVGNARGARQDGKVQEQVAQEVPGTCPKSMTGETRPPHRRLVLPTNNLKENLARVSPCAAFLELDGSTPPTKTRPRNHGNQRNCDMPRDRQCVPICSGALFKIARAFSL